MPVKLTEEQKIAVLMASLDEKVAATVLQQLDPDVMVRVAGNIRRLGVISGEDRVTAITDCAKGILEIGDVVQGDEKTANSLLKAAIGEKRASVMLQENVPVRGSTFSKLESIPPEQIALMISREQPAIITVVLRFLSPDKAGKVLQLLSADKRKRAIVFLCNAGTPSQDVVSVVESFIDSKLGETKKVEKVDEVDKLDVIASMLQNVERDVEEELLSAIEEDSEATASTLKDKLFTFEDIVSISDVAMRRILQEVEMSLLSVSLRGASIDLQSKFFKNMSKRAAESVKEEMEFSQKMKKSEVEDRQREIVNVIRTLEADGQITVGKQGEDEYV